MNRAWFVSAAAVAACQAIGTLECRAQSLTAQLNGSSSAVTFTTFTNGDRKKLAPPRLGCRAESRSP